MQTRELLKATCTILGVIQIVWAVSALGWALQGLRAPRGLDAGQLSRMLGMAGVFASYLISGLILFRYATGIAEWLSKRAAVIHIPVPPKWEGDFTAAAIPLIGVVVTVFAVPQLVRQVVSIWLRLGHGMPWPGIVTLSPILAEALKVGLGIYLMRGGRKFREFIHKSHQGPAPEPEAT